MPFVAVEPDVRIYYESVGRGRPVVLIAGWAYSGEIWDRQVTALCHDYRCVTVDMRGHGDSDKPVNGYTFSRMAQDVGAVLAHLDLRDVTLVGWSMGGSIATKLARLSAERVSRVVTVGAPIPKLQRAPDFPVGRPLQQLLPLIAAELDDRAESRWKVAVTSVHAEVGESTLRWMWQVSLKTPTWSAIEAYRAVIREDLRPDLDSVRARFLVIQGRHDPFVPMELAKWTCANLAARMEIFETSAHVPFLEETDRFNTVLGAFLAEA